MRKLIYTMLAAGLCASGAWALDKADNGCYQIGSYTDLLAFQQA